MAEGNYAASPVFLRPEGAVHLFLAPQVAQSSLACPAPSFLIALLDLPMSVTGILHQLRASFQPCLRKALAGWGKRSAFDVTITAFSFWESHVALGP